MFGFSRARKGATVAAVLAAILAVSIVSPAFGGPSPLDIAKKALRVATTTKKQLRRSYNRTHPTEVAAIDGGERSAPPFGFAEWDIHCPRNHVVAGSAIGYGALEPVSDLSYGSGALITLFNPSDSSFFSGFAVVNCVWGLDSNLSTASAHMSKQEALEKLRQAKKDALAAARQ